MNIPDNYEYVPCNLCGADDSILVLEALPKNSDKNKNSGSSYAASGDSLLDDRLVRCRRCGLVYVNPRLNTRLIRQGYTEADNSTYLQQGAEREATFSRAVHLLNRNIPQKGRLLDVGCAGGFFVKAAKEAGWDASGLEPSRHSCDYARNQLKLQVTQGILREQLFPESSFDVVTMWDVLEHVGDPKGDLLEVHRLLKPGGWLLINFPDYSSIWAKLLGRRWWFLINVHIYYFTPRTLYQFLEAAGFKPKWKKLYFQTLKFGYLIKRLHPYSPFLSNLLARGARSLRLENFPVRYYASQVNVLCQRVDITNAPNKRQ